MLRQQIAHGIYQFGKQIGTADLPDFLKGFSGHKAPHFQRSKWQRRMKAKADGYEHREGSKAFQPATTPTIMRTRKLSHKQAAKAQRELETIMAKKN